MKDKIKIQKNTFNENLFTDKNVAEIFSDVTVKQ